jgi:hypothetical protein
MSCFLENLFRDIGFQLAKYRVNSREHNTCQQVFDWSERKPDQAGFCYQAPWQLSAPAIYSSVTDLITHSPQGITGSCRAKRWNFAGKKNSMILLGWGLINLNILKEVIEYTLGFQCLHNLALLEDH